MVPHAEAGTYPQTGMPWKFSGIPNDIRMPSPLLGEHNRLILGDFLGKSAEEIAELEGAGVIGDRPAHGPA
jgi:formyl-CoA transferase